MMLPREGKFLWIAASVAAILFIVFYALVDPSSVYLPRCPVFSLLGIKCPGCGSQRALHSLLNGELSEAWSYNPAFVCSLPVMGILAFAAVARQRFPRLYTALHSPVSIIVTAVSLAAWGILRNF